jgi:hypothetical protein
LRYGRRKISNPLDTAGESGADVLLSFADSVNCGNQVAQDIHFDDVAAPAGAEGLPRHLCCIVLADEQYFGCRCNIPDMASRRESIQPRQSDVQKDHVGLQLTGPSDRPFAIRSLAHYVQVRLCCEKPAKLASNQLMVIDNQNPNSGYAVPDNQTFCAISHEKLRPVDRTLAQHLPSQNTVNLLERRS